MNLTLIYHFQSFQNEDGEFSPARYQVVYCFTSTGFIENNTLKKLAVAISEEPEASELTFLSLDDLKSFALQVAEELEEDEIRLISVQDFNIGIDGAKDISSFRQIFLGFGELVKAEGTSKKKKGLLSRFF